MKHKHFFIMLSMLMSMAVGSMTLVSCGDDEVEPGGGSTPGSNAEQNTTDVAVTGSVKELGALYAWLNGVVNLEAIGASYPNVQIGVELSTTQDFAEKKRMQVAGLVGRTFSVRPILLPETKYYYRTYVSVSSLAYDYYGETYSFTTKKLSGDIAITGQVELADRTATISGKVAPTDIKAAAANVNIGIEVSRFADFKESRKLSIEQAADFFVLEFDKLWYDTKYFYRTFADISPYPQKVFYGETLTFTEKLEIEGVVELGLPSGTLWATMNVGASKSEEFGDYYAWGETQPKSNYSESDYFDKSYRKYNTGGQKELFPEDDAASVNWGSEWRMPSYEQLKELMDNCTWTWTTRNNVNGYEVVGPSENSIFLPTAGYRCNSSLYHPECGSYWSRSLNSGNMYYAWRLHFSSSSAVINGSKIYRSDGRYLGQSVRPVYAQ